MSCCMYSVAINIGFCIIYCNIIPTLLTTIKFLDSYHFYAQKNSTKNSVLLMNIFVSWSEDFPQSFTSDGATGSELFFDCYYSV